MPLRQRRFPSGDGLNQAVEGDRELANAHAGRVPDEIGDGAGRSRYSDLSDALDAQRVDVRIILFNQNGLERGDVGVHRHVLRHYTEGSSVL
jgi:hypothetical protein